MKAIIKTNSGETVLPIEAISSIEGLSQCNIIVIKQNRETIQGISVKFEKKKSLIKTT